MSRSPVTIARARHLKLMRRGEWEYVDRVQVNGVAVLVPITDDDEIVLVEQYRVPVQATMIELPAGLVGDEEAFRDEGLLEAANRELEEETGYRAGSLTLLARAPSSGGLTSEVVSFLHATDLERVGPGGGAEDEDITVHVIPVAGVTRWLRERERDGWLVDPKIYAGLFLVDAGSRG